MASFKRHIAVVSTVLLLGGCSFATEALFPSDGTEQNDQSTQSSSSQNDQMMASASNESAVTTNDTMDAMSSSQPMQPAPVELGTTQFEPPAVAPGENTGTFVGKKVVVYRKELQQLQANIRQRNAALQGVRSQTRESARMYHENVAFINSRLQAGTTRGNPILEERWRVAQRELNKIPNNVTAMNKLATEVASDSAMAAYLLDSIRSAFTLTGAIEEDHRQLTDLEDTTNQTIVLVERLLNELNADITRQQGYVNNEVSNLNTLAVAIREGQPFGVSLSTTMRANLAPQLASRTGMPGVSPAILSRKPLVVIRFETKNVAYEKAVYDAVRRALEHKPSAMFDVVAVAPARGAPGQVALSGNEARRQATNVMRSLSNMGLPAEQVRMSTTTSADARSPEVRIYVQ